MNWNRELDQVEAKALHDLHDKGYRAVDKKHMIHLKDIYDFISRFADPAYAGNVTLKMSSGEMPTETFRIVRTIGAENLFLYFSPQVYPKKFMNFCEKLIKTKRISSKDYLAEGVIIVNTYEVEERSYEM